MTEETLVYWIGGLIFVCATIAFSVFERRRSSLTFSSNMFVGFITTISYVVMALALGTSFADSGEPIYWTRWLFYIASCSILTYEIAFFAKKTIGVKFEIALFTALTMFCGFLASAVTSVDRWWFFALSTAAYAGLISRLYFKSHKTEFDLGFIGWFVVLFWSMFPLVWLLAPTGFGFISTFYESILYLVLDIITKIVFGFYIIRKL